MGGIAILVTLVLPLLLSPKRLIGKLVLTKYCLGCHNTRAKIGGLVLEDVPAENPASRPDVWEKVIRRVKAGEMPPAGLPTPGEPSLKAFAADVGRDLDAAARRAPYAGEPSSAG